MVAEIIKSMQDYKTNSRVEYSYRTVPQIIVFHKNRLWKQWIKGIVSLTRITFNLDWKTYQKVAVPRVPIMTDRLAQLC